MWLRLYHSLPAPLRSAAATARGFYLKRWRYGPETERLVEEALERERWSPQRWEQWQQERLAYILQRAATQIPYYRASWAERRRRGDRASWEVLANWPILEKETVRAHARALLADGCRPEKMYREHTSGSTGKPLTVYWAQDTVRAYYALAEARWRRWYGLRREDPWGILGGQLVIPVRQRKPPFWVWNQAMRQLYFSSYPLAPDLTAYYLDALVQYRIKYLWGYTSALYRLAQAALEQGRRDLRMAAVITNAEPVYAFQRETIAAAFQAPVRETYGMSELVAAAGECSCGALHLWPEVGRVETLQDNQPVPADTAGDLVCTGLINGDMPLIRYRVGDRAALAPGETLCACGRTLPRLARIEGRLDDVLYTADGRQIGRLDPVFKRDLPVREAQIIQDSLQEIRVRYVPGPGYTPAAGQLIRAALRDRLGPVNVRLEPVAEIPRAAGGKFRAVICQIPPQ